MVQKLVPQLPTLNSLLDILIASCSIEKSYLVDVKTKLYIATDSSPIDAHTYELCADLVDVVIDVSYIYGVKAADHDAEDAGAGGSSRSVAHPTGTGSLPTESTPYDESSTSAIKLNNGMVLYLREVNEYLALVCILRDEYFARRSQLDYNIDCLKTSLAKIVQVHQDSR